jgi:predicted DNA-binding transcriptional regulator YafY
VTKSSESEQARRVNATVRLLNKSSPPEVVRGLIARYRISRRQAYRYLWQAQTARKPLAIPETKSVFTVKISVSLIGQVRRQARRTGGTISQWVEAALRRSLKAPPGHG